MRVSVAVNALIGIALSVLYFVVAGYAWRFRRHWTVIVPIANAIVYALPTAAYIGRMVNGDPDLRPVNWGVLIVVLPAVQVGMLLYWSTRDVVRGKAIAAQAQVYTEEANLRAEERADVEVAEAVKAAAERTERADAAAERTADATERLADSAEGLIPKPERE